MLVPAGAHVTALGARTAWDLTSSHLLSPPACVVPQGVPRGRRAPRGYSRIMVRPASASAYPTLRRAEDCSPTSLPAFLAPLAPPHTRRFLGDSLDARLQYTEPLCTRVAADACECRLCPVLTCVVAHSQHGAWRARSCARVYGTAGEQDPDSLSATTGPSSIHRSTHLDHPPRPPSS